MLVLKRYGNPLLLLDAVTFVNKAAFIFKFCPSHSMLAPSGLPTKNLVVDPGNDNSNPGVSVPKLKIEPAVFII